MQCIEERIAADNAVRVIEALVNALDLTKLNFIRPEPAYKEGEPANLPDKGGAPAYHPQDLLKLYLYGYYNRIRSSRLLERECTRNIEVQWLLKELVPNYHTIADFRKDNRKALKGVFKKFTEFLLNNQLLGGETLAADGTKVRAVNAKKKNYNKDKVERHLLSIENKTEEYLKQLDAIDDQENKEDGLAGKMEKLQSKLSKLKDRKVFYETVAKQISQSDEGQVSTTDPESRSMPIHHNQIEVAYNIQCAADDKHYLIVDFEATNENDTKALYNIAQGAKDALHKTAAETITILADKGYHNGEQLHKCEKANIITIVANPERTSAGEVPTPDYMVEKFIYTKESHTYTCPQGETLTTNASWYTKDHTAKTRRKSTKYLFQQFKTKACKTCPVKHLCTKNAIGRIIDRSQYQDTVDRNNARMINQKERYLRRQQIIEHPFGTIKRAWGYYYTLLKGIEKVNAEYAIIFTVYNLRRTVTIYGVKELIKRLNEFKKTVFSFFYFLTLHKTYRSMAA